MRKREKLLWNSKVSKHLRDSFLPKHWQKFLFSPQGLCFPLDLDAGTPPASFPQGWKGGVVLQLGVKLLSPCQDFGTRDPNPALQGLFVALPLSPKGDSSSSSQAQITKDQTSFILSRQSLALTSQGRRFWLCKARDKTPTPLNLS